MDDNGLTDERKQQLRARASWVAVDVLERDHQEVADAAIEGLTNAEKVFFLGLLAGRLIVVTRKVVELQRELVQFVSETLAEFAMENGPRPYVLGQEGDRNA